ncbi:extracellular serine-rich protein [Diplodia corticola]|uniref:Extracellular serine-rich protein n=1 Tax=Diplodia corticola TaxID=236234 RepID=A0A1J9R0F3_9PEZI|nr:extracellular serine-rich protein [Diplodia corticola]OJD33730.1 extracellular serine-rich protein [Diplodia corticola]
MRRFLATVAALGLATGSLAATHTVSVGANGHNFTPNTTYADPGDIVVFDFYPTNHSVIRGEYSNNTSLCGPAGCNPCVPWELYHADEDYQGFFSGNKLIDNFTNRKTWNLTVNNTEPIWFYCDALDSCSPNGMVGVINPQNGSSFAHQHTEAMDSVYQLAPGQTWPAEGGGSSSSSSSSHHSSSLSGGAIAGIVVGAVAFVVMAAALFFFVGRSRAYGKFFKHAHSQPPISEIGDHGSQPGGVAVGGGSMPPWSDHTPSRIGSPPPTMPGSPPLGSEKPANPARWSDSTAFTNANNQPRYSSPPPQEHLTFVGYNRQTGAPEFAQELPGDHEIHQVGSPDARVIGRSPVEMDAEEARRIQGGR